LPVFFIALRFSLRASLRRKEIFRFAPYGTTEVVP
jgi:hypothetical protein